MNTNIEKICKEADLRLQVQMIEGYSKTIAFVTDGTHDVNENIVKIIHENSKKILEGVKNYYTIEEEIKHMKYFFFNYVEKGEHHLFFNFFFATLDIMCPLALVFIEC